MEKEAIKAIKSLRESKGMNQGSIAEFLGMSITSYSKIERGETKLTINHLERIAKALDVSPYEILGINNNEAEELKGNNKKLQDEIERLRSIEETYNLIKPILKVTFEAWGRIGLDDPEDMKRVQRISKRILGSYRENE